MNREQILQAFDQVWNQAKSQFNLSIPKPVVTFTTKGSTAGQAWRSGIKVQFNLTLAKSAGDEFLNTITHELAHIVQFQKNPRSKPHGPEFKMYHKALGGTGERCHSYSLEALPNRHKYTCGCRDFFLSTIKHNKILKGASYSCVSCKQKLFKKD